MSKLTPEEIQELQYHVAEDKVESFRPGKVYSEKSKLYAKLLDAYIEIVDEAELQEDCPFCHGSQLEAVNNDDRIEGWQIYCWACGCKGPEAQSEELAWKAWKQRSNQ